MEIIIDIFQETDDFWTCRCCCLMNEGAEVEWKEEDTPAFSPLK